MAKILLISCVVLMIVFLGCSDEFEPPGDDSDDASENKPSSTENEYGDENTVEPVEVVDLSGRLTSRTLESTTVYRLVDGAVTVPAGEILKIEPGTVIRGSHSPRSWLEVEPGGKIIAEGTPTQPIVLTSDKPDGSQAAGDWGGLIIAGDAVGHFKAGGDPNDSSGILRYVRVEYAGSAYGDGHFNGISFEYVGAGTVVEYLQVLEVLDDAIELYGGSVNLQYVLVTGYRDDGIDWTYGYTGTIQYLICQKTGERSDRGIEGDNNPDAPNMEPRSRPYVYNATIVGMSHEGILLRNGGAAIIKNSIVIGCERAGLMVDATSANRQAAVQAMEFTHNIFFDNHPNLDDTAGMQTNATEIADAATTLIVDPQLNGIVDGDWTPEPGSPALDAAHADRTISHFIGAIGAVDWTKGWIHR